MAKTENQNRALAALMDESNTSLTQAAKAAGITRRTMYTYMRNDDFLTAYRQMREQQAITRAEEMAVQREEALGTIRSLMTDTSQPGPVRLKAAATLLSEHAEAQAKVDAVLKSCEFSSKWF